MADAFIIMQIGSAELDDICAKCIVPAIEVCGMSAKRVDKHNQGGLLKSEIIKFIESAEIIIADLTNERPNCYLEVGYAMGVDKFRNLILTARDDHNPGSPTHKKGGPRVHFDLSGYDILFWHPGKLEEFRAELEKRIRRRLAVIQPGGAVAQSPWDLEWTTSHRNRAFDGYSKMGLGGFMEVRFALDHPKPSWNQMALDEAARSSNIETFGWPIGVYVTGTEFRPKPKADGIVAEVAIKDRHSYDYWTLRRNGDFYLLKSLFEDARDRGKLFFDTRIVRVTEVFLYCARLYSRLGVDSATVVNIGVRHSGLNRRILAAANSGRLIHDGRTSAEDEVAVELRVPMGSIESRLVVLVKEVTVPIFVLFDYFEVGDSTYEQLVNSFVQGRIV